MLLQGTPVQEPYRRSLGRAIQWFDVLQIELDNRIEKILAKCRERITHPATPVDLDPVTAPSDQAHTERSRPSTICDPLLSQRCPACFGGSTFGRPLNEGADIHVATDGNFHHRHRRTAGDCPTFYQPRYFLPKSQVDAVGKRIEKARKRPLRSRTAQVPDEAVDQCESSYEAADGKKQKTSMESYDDTGVMAIICRHDIPLFFANIDTPGEQQKYSVALIEHIFSLLPPQATVVVLYDVGCVLDRSLAQVGLPPNPVPETNPSHSMTCSTQPLRRDCGSRPQRCTRTGMNGLVN